MMRIFSVQDLTFSSKDMSRLSILQVAMAVTLE